jgi:hypothetical protein
VLDLFDKESRDMADIRSGNEDAYEAAYKALYPKEVRPWGDVEREAIRVQDLNSRKPPGARDIQTYGSRIAEAVVAAVNETARALRKAKDGDR